MLYQLQSYLKFLIRSGNQHGVHSPFVYNLITKCFYDKKKYNAYPIIEKYRAVLRNDRDVISITDFGAGSKVFKDNKRPVYAIAKNAGVTKKRQQLLCRLSNYFQPKTILELGTSLGLGTVAMNLGNPSAKITTVEGCTAISAKAQHYFTNFKLENIHLKTSSFNDFFQQKTSETFDFVYVDGNHSKEATLRHFKALLPRVNNDTVLIFDDIYWSPEMTAAWRTVISHHQVTVSIDTFQWGFVFFRKEQPKQHFYIRV